MIPRSRANRPPDTESGTGRWVVAIIAICVVWLIAMVAASYTGLEYKTPVRIENWKPVAAGAAS